MNTLRTVLAALLLALIPVDAHAAKPVPLPDHWVGTWATAPYSLDPGKTLTDLGLGTQDVTLRQIVHVSLGGPLVRIEFTNEFGTEPLTIGAAHMALAVPGTNDTGDISLASAHALTFGGKPSIIIPPGAIAISDPAALTLATGADLVISLFLPAQKLTHASFHSSAYQTSFLVQGNAVGAKSLTAPQQTLANQVVGAPAPTPGPAAGQPAPRKISQWFFLKGVDVRVPGEDGAVVAFGDSITDGTQNVVNSNQRWPDYLARRLQGNKTTQYLGVLNAGIGGNRILHDGTGPSALARFDRDVLGHPGVKILILMEGINDIGHAADPVKPYDPVTADDLIQGMIQLTERAHDHGIRVIGATLTPYGGAKYASPAGEAMRQALNTWIRTSNLLDGVVDFDKATQDPAHPDMFLPALERGDHLHPKDEGFKKMADAFDLNLFAPIPKEKLDIKYFKE